MTIFWILNFIRFDKQFSCVKSICFGRFAPTWLAWISLAHITTILHQQLLHDISEINTFSLTDWRWDKNRIRIKLVYMNLFHLFSFHFFFFAINEAEVTFQISHPNVMNFHGILFEAHFIFYGIFFQSYSR